MGWWSQTRKGDSFSSAKEDQNFLWGDTVADVLDECIAIIVRDFTRNGPERKPSKNEIRAGLEFALSNLDLPEDPDEAPVD